MNLKQLDSLMRKWQKVLRLQDWDITLAFVDPDKLSPKCSGRCEYEVSLKSAHIKILAPKHWEDQKTYMFRKENTPNYLVRYCIEPVLVHEMLHLYFCYLELDEPLESLQKAMIEQAIECISDGFVGLKYNEFPKR